jgi:glyoxylase I family protein
MAIDVRGMAPLFEVFDMPTSIGFYCDVLGFSVVSASGPVPHCGWVLLSLNDVELMLNTAYDDGQRPAQPEGGRLAAHHDTAIYFGCSDVDAAYRHLRERNIAVKPPEVAYYGMKQLYVSDPDGYNLCFQWPVSAEAKQQWQRRYGMETRSTS